MLSGFFQDYNDVVLRVYENEGRATRAELELPAEPHDVEFVNLLGDPMDDPRPIERNGPRLAFDIEPWEIVTIRFPSPEARGQFPDEPDEPEPEEPRHPRWRT